MNITLNSTGDDLGPTKILYLRQSRPQLEAFVVIDNVACGPALGGIRMAPDVTVDEVLRLARAMTLKNAAAGLPHGGGKAGIVADPAMPIEQKEQLVRAFARAIGDFSDYIPGPDMGVNEECMAWIKDEIGRVAGLPRVLGGIPLDEIGATGFGLAAAADLAAPYAGIALRNARMAIQGFGAVGIHAARFLAERGVKLVAVSDSNGALSSADGLSIEALIAHKKSGQSVKDFAQGKSISAADLVGVDCDIWIPAARPDVLDERNVSNLKARMVLQGANIPATEAAERWMHAHGVLNLPDFVANSGGVICASVEYHGGTEGQAMSAIEDRIKRNTRDMLDRAQGRNCMPREAAIEIARNRIIEAQTYRRYC
jgi:glutamate dehydrogenase/leucine dehydrogenase